MFLRRHAAIPTIGIDSVLVSGVVSGVNSIEATVSRIAKGDLAFNFRLLGDPARLLIPDVSEGNRVDGLWEHTCFEAFVAEAGADDYLELNFSPSGDWAAYAFSGYRLRNSAADPLTPPLISCRHLPDGILLEARVSSDATCALQIGLTAVIEGIDGQRSYWALAHAEGEPLPRPDFHRRESFILTLPSPEHFS